MTDHKAWIWKKKSSEKTTIAADLVKTKGNEEEIKRHLREKAELERDLKVSNEKLSLALSDCNAKDNLVKKNAQKAQEVIAGWEKAESEAMSLKQELEEVTQKRVAGEERLSHLDAGMKECMQQLRFVREEQEQRIHDAMMKTSREFEKIKLVLEQKLAETTKKLTKSGTENTQLSKALLAKEKLIYELNEHKTQAEAEFNGLMTRLESIEKENASLKYEVRVLEKELEIRNEEREFNRRTADVAHKQHLESVKKIAKLESECHRLRVLVRKRLPGPAALVKMKNEVEMLSRDPAEARGRKSNLSPGGSMDFAVDNDPDTPNKKINLLTGQLYAVEEENRNLKETLNKKANELQFSRIMYARTASRLSQVETQLEESSKGQTKVESARNLRIQHELSLASTSDMGSDDKVSCAESWASALISELDHFKTGRQSGTPSGKTVGVSDINLMDDFVEMEKLAIVSADKQFGCSHLASDEGSEIFGPMETKSVGYSSAAAHREMVLASDDQSGVGVFNQEIQPKNKSIDEVPGWLLDILKVVWEQTRVTQRTADEILEDIKVALAYMHHPNPGDLVDAREISNHPNPSNTPCVSSCISWKSPRMNSSDQLIGDDISLGKKSNQQLQSNLSKSIYKIIELIEGINLPALDSGGRDGKLFPYKNSETSTGYIVRVFQWKTSELGAILRQFIQTCKDLLHGKADLENFADMLTSALDWIMNHCFSLQDVSSMKDAIRKQFDWDETRSESEAECGMISQFSELDRLHAPKDQFSYLPIVSASCIHNSLFQMEELQPNVREDTKRLKDEFANMESAKKDLEGKLQSEIDKSESLMIQLRESEKTIGNLQTKLETSKKSKGTIGDQIENKKLVNENSDTEFTIARVELNEGGQKFSSLNAEPENTNILSEEPKATCLDLQFQPESKTKKEISKYELEREEKQFRTDWEITAASEKLAECQETILNLGKQLKALASPSEATFLDKVISTPTDGIATTTTQSTPMKSNSQRTSLLDKMLAEDNAEAGFSKSFKTKEVIYTSDAQKSPSPTDGYSRSALHPTGATDPPARWLDLNGVKHNQNNALFGPLAIVPSKKKESRGFFKKLLCKRKGGK